MHFLKQNWLNLIVKSIVFFQFILKLFIMSYHYIFKLILEYLIIKLEFNYNLTFMITSLNLKN